MPPLYCYKYDMDTQELVEICIEHYTKRTNEFTERSTYSWTNPKVNKSYTHESVSDEKLDRFVNGKVYTFAHSKDYVLDIIAKDIDRRLELAIEQQIKWQNAKAAFCKKYPSGV